MTTIKDIFTTYGPEYITRFGNSMPGEHRKVIDAIINCRSDHYGASIYQCTQCGQRHMVYRCCGNRHCPNCQHHKTRKWLQNQLDRQLPGHHFMITFTVPQNLRGFIRSHQRVCYSAMFAASSQTIKKLAADEKYIGADMTGFFGVLHTWGRQMPYHPHIHYIVPGGAFSKTDGKWHCSRIDFFLPVKAMSKIFAAKFRDIMKKSGLYPQIPADVWNQKWVVNCQAIGAGQQSIKYLAAYVFKVAISNSRIVKVEDRKVFFRYRKNKSNRWRTMALDVMEFIRRFVQHVLPTGLMKIRYYGFLHPGSSVPLEKIAALIELAFGFEIVTPKTVLEPSEPMTCTSCGGSLALWASLLPCKIVLADSG
ncbi:MAG: transposase [Desulfobacterales bacterium]